MENGASLDLFHGFFTWQPRADGGRRLLQHPTAPTALPDPVTGLHLQIATVDIGSTAICPECDRRAEGGFISFVSDLRVVYACPECCRLVWINGA
jgi:hypothetical protein